jgi:hypothetical protein
MIDQELLEILFVGDATIWLVKKESHSAWLDVLKNDFEFGLISAVVNVHSSLGLDFVPEHYFMNSIYPTPAIGNVDIDNFKQYYNDLSKYTWMFNAVHSNGKTNEFGKYINTRLGEINDSLQRN